MYTMPEHCEPKGLGLIGKWARAVSLPDLTKCLRKWFFLHQVTH